MNILIKMAFNGGAYHGFQVQKNALSVCTVLQNAMQNLFGRRPDVKGCSRTDAGVHALEYYVSFKCETDIPLDKLPLALNYHLPADIRVYGAQQVEEDFHARYSALGKAYRYVVRNSQVDNPFAAGLYARIPGQLNAQDMHCAGQQLVGKHDFKAFMSAGSSVEDTVRTISALSVRREEEQVVLRVAADGFLYNMVRIIAGTLLCVGAGQHPANWVKEVRNGQNRKLAGQTMPPQGLFLEKVFYPPQHLPVEL